MPGSDVNRGAPDAKNARQQSHQFIIGGAAHWRRRDPYAQSAVMFAHNLAARSTRNNLHLESQFSIFFRVVDHRLEHFKPFRVQTLVCSFFSRTQAEARTPYHLRWIRLPEQRTTIDQPPMSVPTVARCNSWSSSRATSGDMSNPPREGIIRRSGPSTGSVAFTRNRINRFE
jgi:hypothetical protein